MATWEVNQPSTFTLILQIKFALSSSLLPKFFYLYTELMKENTELSLGYHRQGSLLGPGSIAWVHMCHTGNV